MTQDEARELLDSMLYPFEEVDENTMANGNLSSYEENILLQIVIDFEVQSESYDYISAINNIAVIMKRFVKLASVTSKNTKIVLQPDAAPFLIHQVLFFIAVSCSLYKRNGKALDNQKGIIQKLNNELKPLSVSRNFFSRMHTTPSQYVSMMRYEQPKLPADYMGQKVGKLAVAIKNLVYQAGKYDIFCDIFGGSGAASLAVDKRKDAKYVYNEKNRVAYNLLRVLADDKLHKELIGELELLQKDLRGDGAWLEEDGYDFDAEVEQFFNSRRGNRTDREVKVMEDGVKDLDIDFNDIVNYMETCRQIILTQPSDYTFTFEGITYSKNKLLNEIFPDTSSVSSHMKGYDSFMSFCRNYKLIIACDLYFLNTIIGEYTSGMNQAVVKERLYSAKKRQEQYRFYKYYAYFDNLVNQPGEINSGDMVRYAVAEIYLQSLTTNGSVDISAVMRMNYGPGGASRPSVKPKKFLEKNFEEIITNVHKVVKGTICECLDCIDVINKYKHDSQQTDIKHNLPLFYSDSPYAETKDYNDNVNGVDKFGSQEMKDLIFALRDSGDNFIFSCRAVKGSANGSDITETLKNNNRGIFAHVFEHFLAEFIEKGKKLWVLAIEDKNSTLSSQVKDNKIAEVMITNYEIHDFEEEDTIFKVYTFWEFLQVLVDDANA